MSAGSLFLRFFGRAPGPRGLVFFLSGWILLVSSPILQAQSFLAASAGRPEEPTLRAQDDLNALETRFPWLRDRSSFRFGADLDKSLPPPNRRGAYPLGNGLLFGTVGLIGSPGTLSHLGPLGAEENFPQSRVDLFLTRNGQALHPRHWRIAPIRGSAIVESTLHYPGLSLHVIDAIPPGLSGTLRVIVVRNRSTPTEPQTLDHLRIDAKVAALGGEKRSAELRIAPTWYRGTNPPTLALPAPRSESDSGHPTTADTLGVEVPPLGPGEAAILTLLLAVEGGSSNTPSSETRQHFEKTGLDLLQHTHNWWRWWTDSKTRVRGSQPRLGDLLDRLYIQIGTSRLGRSGPFLSPLKHRNVIVADQWPVGRALARAGDESSARDATDSLVEVSHRTGAIADSYPSSAFSLKGPSPDPPKSLQVTAKRLESVTAPVLLHELLFSGEGFQAHVYARWPYLLDCIRPVLETSNGKRPWEGAPNVPWISAEALTKDHDRCRSEHVAAGKDRSPKCLETVLFAVLSVQAMDQLFHGLGLSSRERYRFSRHSTNLRRTVEEHFAQVDLGTYAPYLSPLTGERHLVPLTPVNLAPLWHGYSNQNSSRALDALDTLLQAVATLYEPRSPKNRNLPANPKTEVRPRSVVRLTPSCQSIPAEGLGRLLYALAEVDHPDAALVLQTLLDAASPSGDFASLHHAVTLRPQVPDEDRLDLRAAATIAEAILKYLAGVELLSPTTATLNPKLPLGSDRLVLHNLQCGENSAHLTLARPEGDRLRLDLSSAESRPMNFEFNLALPGNRVRRILCNNREIPGLFHSKQGRYYGTKGHVALGRDLDKRAITLELEFDSKPTESHLRSGSPELPEELLWRNLDRRKYTTVILGSTQKDAERGSSNGTRVVDVGLPMSPRELATTFYDLERDLRRCETLILGTEWFKSSTTHLKDESFWKDPDLARALREFEAKGGTIVGRQSKD